MSSESAPSRPVDVLPVPEDDQSPDAQKEKAEDEDDSEGGEEAGEDEVGEDGEGDEDESDAVTGASDLEEEEQYADQPACGLSPRLVVRRGCETLKALDAASAGPSSNDVPRLSRVDTVAGFESAVGPVGVEPIASLPRGGAPPISRVETMSGLPEVREAFDALSEYAVGEVGASSGANAAIEQMPVKRVDTMELLMDPDAADERALKRPKT